MAQPSTGVNQTERPVGFLQLCYQLKDLRQRHQEERRIDDASDGMAEYDRENEEADLVNRCASAFFNERDPAAALTAAGTILGSNVQVHEITNSHKPAH